MSSKDMNKLAKLYETMLHIQIAEKEEMEREADELSNLIAVARAKHAELGLDNLFLQAELDGRVFDDEKRLEIKELNRQLEENMKYLIKTQEDLVKIKQSIYEEKLKMDIPDQMNNIEFIKINTVQLEAEKSDKAAKDYETKANMLKEQHLQKINKIKKTSGEVQLQTKSLREARKDQEFQELTLARKIDYKKHRLQVRQSRSANLSKEYNYLQGSKKKLQKRLESAKMENNI